MRRSILVAGAAVLAVAALVVPAHSGPVADATNVSTVAAPETQVAHFDVINAIAAFDALQPVSQLGSVEGDPVAGTIQIGWVGEVPADVEAIADNAAADGIAVTFVAEDRSQQALIETALQVATALPTDASVVISVDPDALTIGVPTEEVAAETGDETIPLDQTGLDTIDEAIETAGAEGVPIDVEAEDGVPTQASLAMGRSGDVNDLRGGSRYLTQFLNGRYINCTSGFQAVYGHIQHFITAAHCSDYADNRNVTSTGNVMLGVSDAVAELNDGGNAYDLGLVRLGIDIYNLPQIYTNSSTLRVTGWLGGGVPSGYNLCSSGAVSGTLCNLVSGGPAVACYATGRGSTECVNVIRVTATTGTTFCFGDSGGPVYAPTNSTDVIAAAIVSGIVVDSADGRCGSRGYIAPVSQLLNSIWGLQLRTVTPQ